MKRSIIFLFVLLSSGWLYANHWTPEDAQFEDNMTLTGVIVINGEEQQSADYEVGAFCGDECRGSVLPTYFSPTQRYIIQLTIFGEMGDLLTFKIYDHSQGVELDVESPEAVTFNGDSYGSLGNPYVLHFTSTAAVTYQVAVSASPVEGGTVTGGGTFELGQTCTMTAVPNEGYLFVNWTEMGEVVSSEATYSFTVTEDRVLVANFIVETPVHDEVVITLLPGWNWISYLLKTERPLSEALVNLTPEANDVIKGMASTSMFKQGSWQGNLDKMVPGVGYMYYNNSTLTKTFTYPNE